MYAEIISERFNNLQFSLNEGIKMVHNLQNMYKLKNKLCSFIYGYKHLKAGIKAATLAMHLWTECQIRCSDTAKICIHSLPYTKLFIKTLSNFHFRKHLIQSSMVKIG